MTILVHITKYYRKNTCGVIERVQTGSGWKQTNMEHAIDHEGTPFFLLNIVNICTTVEPTLGSVEYCMIYGSLVELCTTWSPIL
jgi:hypothetical protein